MNTRSPFDWSALDPSQDEARWAHTVASVAERAAATRRRQLSVVGQLARWSTPVFGIAAAVALVSWGCAMSLRPKAIAVTSPEPSVALMQWASADEVPSVTEVLSSMGGNRE